MNKNWDFLDDCIDFLDSLTDAEIEKLKQIYKEEMEKKCGETEFEILLPEEKTTLSFNYIPTEEKHKLDYKIPLCEETIANSLNSMAA